MNAFQTCTNTADAVPLYLPQQLYVKPIARMTMSIQLPNVKKLGKSISHWEMMERLRDMIKPDEFTLLKVIKTTIEFVRFEGELEDRKKLEKGIARLDNRTMKLKDIPDLMRIRATEAKSDFPSRHAWDNFFHEAKDMNEMKPGERPDTMHISNLPTKWFVPYHESGNDDLVPSEKIFYRVFEKFGNIRYVDIPLCDPYRSKMKDSISGIKTQAIEENDFFEAYIQFKDYIGFTKAMDFFRGMKLLHKEDEEVLTVNIKVDFDRSKHLSDASIRRREIVRDRLVKKQQDKEEKEKHELEEKNRKEENERQRQIDLKLQKQQRRKIREEKRKAKVLEKLKIKGADEINEKIAKEEKKLLKVQRKLEAIRLVEELFRRINEKDKDEDQSDRYHRRMNKNEELQRYKNTSELEVLNQREILHHAIKGRVMLKSILASTKKIRSISSSSSDTDSSSVVKKDKHANSPPIGLPPEAVYDPRWYGYPYHIPTLYPSAPRGHPAYLMYPHRGRGQYRTPLPGPSRGGQYPRRGRGYNPRYRGGYQNNRSQYPPDLEEEYIKYFSKFLHEHDVRENSRSYSRSPRRSRSRHRSYSRSRSHSKRSRTRSRSTSRNRSRSRRRSYSRSRSRSRSHSSRSKTRARRSRSRSRRRTRSKSEQRSKSPHTSSRSRSKRRSSRSKSRSIRKSRSVSVDSSKFISPKSMRKARSKSWSMPRENDKQWSRSPENKD